MGEFSDMQELQNRVSDLLGFGSAASCEKAQRDNSARIPFLSSELSANDILILLVAAFLLISGKDRLLAVVLIFLALYR